MGLCKVKAPTREIHKHNLLPSVHMASLAAHERICRCEFWCVNAYGERLGILWSSGSPFCWPKGFCNRWLLDDHRFFPITPNSPHATLCFSPHWCISCESGQPFLFFFGKVLLPSAAAKIHSWHVLMLCYCPGNISTDWISVCCTAAKSRTQVLWKSVCVCGGGEMASPVGTKVRSEV